LRANAAGAEQEATAEQLRSRVLEEVAETGLDAEHLQECMKHVWLSGTCQCPRCEREKRERAEAEEREELNRVEQERREAENPPPTQGDVGLIIARDEEKINVWRAELRGRCGALLTSGGVWSHSKEVVLADPEPGFTVWDIRDEDLDLYESSPLGRPIIVVDPDDGQECVICESQFRRTLIKAKLAEGTLAVITACAPLVTVVGWGIRYDEEWNKRVLFEGPQWELGKKVLVQSLNPGWGPQDFVKEEYSSSDQLEDIVLVRDPEDAEEVPYAVDRSDLRCEQEFARVAKEVAIPKPKETGGASRKGNSKVARRKVQMTGSELRA
jgi:hypothetical protein